MSQEYIPDFVARREEYVLHNAGPEEISASWGGIPFTLPGCDQLHPRDPAVYPDGTPIPGTLVLRDTYCPDKDGLWPVPGDPYNWRAAVAIKNVLGIDPSTGRAVGAYARKGVSWVRMPTTKEAVQKLMADGKRRYYEFMVQWADHQIRAHAEAVDRAQRAGVATPPPGSDYHRAVTIMNQHQSEIEKRYGKQKEDLAELAEEDDLEFMVYAKARLEGMAVQAAEAQGLEKQAFIEKVLQDPDVLKNLRKKYRIRKVGYAEGVLDQEDAQQVIPVSEKPADTKVTQRVVLPGTKEEAEEPA